MLPKAIWNRFNVNRNAIERIPCTVLGRTCAGRVEILAHMPYGDVTRWVPRHNLEVTRAKTRH